MLRQGNELDFSVPLAGQIPQVGFGLIAENGFAESVKPAAFSITIGSVLHLFISPPNLRESEKLGPVVPFPVSMLLR